MTHEIEQLAPIQRIEHEKDLGWDPECGNMTYVRVYHETKVRVPEALLSDDLITPVGLFISKHSEQVVLGSELHNLLAEKYPNHKGWGHFGVIAREGNILHIEWRGY